MTNLLDDLAEFAQLCKEKESMEYGPDRAQAYEACLSKAFHLLDEHAAEIERNARDAESHENERRDTLLMVMALVDSAGGRVEIGCSSILRADHLRLVRERNPETGDEIFRTVPNADDAMRGGGE